MRQRRRFDPRTRQADKRHRCYSAAGWPWRGEWLYWRHSRELEAVRSPPPVYFAKLMPGGRASANACPYCAQGAKVVLPPLQLGLRELSCKNVNSAFLNVFRGSTRKLHLWKWLIAFPFSFFTSESSKRGRARQANAAKHSRGWKLRGSSGWKPRGSNGLEAARVGPLVRRGSKAESRTKGRPTHSVVATSLAESRKPVRY